MSDIKSYIINFKNTSLKKTVAIFIEKMQNLNNEKNIVIFCEKINDLFVSLIQLCVKNNIDLFINKSFTDVMNNFFNKIEEIIIEFCSQICGQSFINFKKELEEITLDEFNFIDTDEKLILIFNKLSKNQKNKVSFKDTVVEYTYNTNNDKKNTNEKIKIIRTEFYKEQKINDKQQLSIMIKLLLTNESFIEKFQKKLYKICKNIS
jgi:hypothetical protein